MKVKFVSSFLVAALCLAVSSVAAAQFFDGGTSNPGDWNDPINWDGDVLPTGNVEIGDAGTVSPATANITGPLTSPTIADLRVGLGGTGGGSGTLNMSSGSLTATGWAFIGVDGPPGSGNIGEFNLSGDASFDVDFAANAGQQEFHVGLGGGAGSNNSGFVTVADNATLSFPRGYIGSNDGNTGVLDQSGGAVQVDTWMSIGRDGGAGGAYNMSGGLLTVGADGLTVGENNGAAGFLTVSGSSTITTPLLNIGRFGGGAVGTLDVIGSFPSITASTALNMGSDSGADTDATGTLNFYPDVFGLSPISAADVDLNDGSVIGGAFLNIFTPLPAGNNLLIDNTGPNPVVDTFVGLPEGTTFTTAAGDMRTITYVGGDGNDIWLLEAVTKVPGDADGDGDVDLLDLDALGANFGLLTGATCAEGDFDGDGDVDLLDLDILGANFGFGVPSASVPEPASICLAVLAASCLICRRCC